MKKRWSAWSMVILTLSAASLSGCRAAEDTANQPYLSSAKAGDGTGDTASGTLEALSEEEEVSGSSEEKSRYPAGKKGDEYILPAAQDHLYTKEELSGLTREELRLARNEIYARHGRKFKAEDLNAYFREKAWYTPSVEAGDFDDSILSQAEKDNLEQIMQMEKGITGEEIACPVMGREEFPKIDGSTATLPLSQAIYRLCTGASQKEAESSVEHWKTTPAYLGLIQNQGTDLVIAYEPGEDVRKTLEENGDVLEIKPIGRDALVFLANSQNPVKSLTQKQLRDIYTGKISNWKEVGGKSQAIKAFQRPESSGSQNLMEKLVMKGEGMAQAPVEYIYSTMEGVIEGLASYDNTGEALGYSVYFYAKNMYQKPELRFMAVDGVSPSNETIRDASYPLVNDFYAAIRKDEPKDSTAYQIFQWLTTEDGQALINELGYVGLLETDKKLPVRFEENESFSAEIPIGKDELILGDGKFLYGESGLAVFDKDMKLLRFIRHMALLEAEPFYVGKRDEVLAVLDTLSGEFGLYAIGEERWVCEPEYLSIDSIQDGFEMRRKQSVWTEEEGGRWTLQFDYADQRGRIVKRGATESISDQESREAAWDAESFAKRYPVILEKYQVGVDAIESYCTDYQSLFCINEKNGMAHYYDAAGRRLFEFDKNLAASDSFFYPTMADNHMAYLTVSSSDGSGYRYYIYQDGSLVKTLLPEEMGGDFYLSYVGDKFYACNIGNYMYVYNYQGEPCAKFLYGTVVE